jgi:tetratricopeptide (TPR) repeat protein
MNLPFQYEYFLWLLLLIPIVVAIYFYAKHKKQAVFKNLGDKNLVEELTSSYNKKSFPIKFGLLLSAFTLLIVSIANLRTSAGINKITRNGIDVMIAIDVSKSMLAQDVKPNRLERAKQLLGRLIDKLSNDRIGIVVFAGRAYLQMPLTADHSAAKMYLNSASPETVPYQGTVIAEALKACNNSFNTKEKKYKSVIVISDGEDHDDNAIKIAGKMADEGVVINTVGIGSPQGTTIIDELTNVEKKDNDGNVVITKLNEQALADIAAKGNGNYQLFSNTDEVANNLYKQLSLLDGRAVKDDSLINYKSWFQYLLIAALIFLIIELFISEIKKNTLPKMKIIATFIFMFFSVLSFAQAENGTIKKGNDAYKKSDFETAITNYGEALQKNAGNSTAQFNLGNALYKSDKKDEAANAFDKAASTLTKPTEKSNALYNKGVSLQNNKKLEESIAAYKSALKIDPTNADARHNLQLALKQQQQQQQKDKDDKDKKKDKEKDPKDDKKDKDKKDNKDDKKEEEKPKENKSNMSQKDAEQKLQALLQKEKDLQDKMHKVNAASNKADKDW